MKQAWLALVLVIFVGLVGCNRGDNPVGAEAGNTTTSGGMDGTGGDGSGPTGTGGSEPADNPAGDDLKAGGTGTDAPSPKKTRFKSRHCRDWDILFPRPWCR